MVQLQTTATAKEEGVGRRNNATIEETSSAAYKMISPSAIPSLDRDEDVLSGQVNEFSKDGDVPTVRVNVRYRNESGRSLVLSRCLAVHCDFGQLNSTLNVTLPSVVLPILVDDPNIERCDNDGAVRYCYTK